MEPFVFDNNYDNVEQVRPYFDDFMAIYDTIRRWRVVCEGGKYDTLADYPSYDSRDQAAFAEREIVRGMSN